MYYFELGCLSLAAPLTGAIFSYLQAFYKQRISNIWYIFPIFVSFITSSILLLQITQNQEPIQLHFFNWIKSETIRIDWGFLIDPLTGTMITLVTFVSLLVHIYSVEYMENDPDSLTFFSYLNLFTFMMILLVGSPNMIQLFCGWEGVGLASYLLIGFWYQKTSATKAAIKAFIINRIGDIGLILALGCIFYVYGTFDFLKLTKLIHADNSLTNQNTLNMLGIFLFIAAMGKSGQFLLHTWLPDAMEAPTPVSALLHAATMVTAGVFLILRFNHIIELAPLAKQIMMIIGLLTGIFAGTVACTQTDIKKIIAYSTCSQLGMMFISCAAGAYTVAFFHLFTHAFFKSLLFLSAGSIIHAMSHEQNILRMGGLKSYLPFAYYTMAIGVLSLTGVPFFAGYYSKELIVEAVYQQSVWYYGFFLVLIILTSIYSWRMFLLVFHGNNRSDEQLIAHIHPLKSFMKFPTIILSISSVIIGYLGQKNFITQSFLFKWNSCITSKILKTTPIFITLLPLFLIITSSTLCYWLYVQHPIITEKYIKKFPRLYLFIYHKCFFDELYEEYISKPLENWGKFLYLSADKKIIDHFGPNGIANLSLTVGKIMQKPQTGYINHYGLLIVLGVVIILGFYIILQIIPDLKQYLSLIMGHL